MKTGEFVTNWVIDTVKEQYADDIALVISHTTLRMDSGAESGPGEKIMSYFVPVTKKGEQFARTFILAGEGFDIWAVSWERLEKFADLLEYNITCLADAEILYARTPEDAEKFLCLKRRQAANLADKRKMRACALEAYAQAKSIYLEMLFAKGSDIKLGAGYVLDYLARAIAFSNLCYFKGSQTNQLEELKAMEHVPDGFSQLYLQVIRANGEEQKKQCHRLIALVQSFLLEGQEEGTDKGSAKEHNFQDLADWYGELSYTWLRIRHYAAQKDAVKVYMWGVCLQSELDQVCEDFGLEKMDLMSCYRWADLETFAEHASRLEKKMRTIIQDGGGVIHEYRDIEEFLHEV